MARDHKRLGDLLIEARLITAQNLTDAIAEQRRTGDLLGATLVRMGLVREDALMRTLQQQLGLSLIDLSERIPDDQALTLVREDLARKYVALPIEIEGRSSLIVAMADPLNVAALEDLRFHSGMFIKPVLALGSAIMEGIERHYHIDNSMSEVINNIISTEEDVIVSAVSEEDLTPAIDDLIKESEGRPIVRLTNWLLHRAIEERASDIHIEPQDRELMVRFRVDGLLQEAQRLPKWTQSAIVSRIKVLSNLDIAEKRQPQDGRLMVEVRSRRVDMRVSTLPTTHGEKVVIRVIDQGQVLRDLDDLGFYADELKLVQRDLDRPQGIVLVTGPTGSGKSTLLYAALRYIQNVTKNIVTVEDPVEYQIPGLNQVQVDEKGKKTFPSALRAILRQDPDVIMIGEIRDKETAQIAFRASITGHLVLTTVHTNDAASAVTRLIDLGLEPFMVASSLISVVSMRLVRTLCPRCRETYDVGAAALNRLGARDVGEGTVRLSRGRGCPHCRSTGYHGRTGVFEVLTLDDATRGLITQQVSDAAIRAAAVERGMRTMGEDGLKKVIEGRTTLDEVTRVIYLADQAIKTCPSCATTLSAEFEYCPSCGEFVGEHCEHCHRRVETGWTFCPYCGEASRGAAGANGAGAHDSTGEGGDTPEITHRRRRAPAAPRMRKAS
ncbi:MAG: Flp pilus assembly complex ATPase component TadA [Candidatus Eisenbacteria bacterium]|uniref:Flp pilus assembly complex ATPase component TadA n=1 Tax=Eiseniibacteriota bacterium TaxID=2212470 RepID=A0A9D6QIR8_UNCEI|nr:Flp pilus assembly complex ATPase component TadA [Candidatus Eisenbacteria bacterium]MBI3539722.1 Flp pilus assembly complex ATPase component TadA [Candidatus Eisenbacteria bacterium]